MRSQFAAAFLKQMRPELEVSSAGTDVDIPGQTLAERAVTGEAVQLALAVADESGLDLADNTRTQLTRNLAQEQDLIIYMTQAKETPAYIKNNKAAVYWEVPDPRALPKEGVCKTRDTIKNYIEQLAKLL